MPKLTEGLVMNFAIFKVDNKVNLGWKGHRFVYGCDKSMYFKFQIF